MKNSINYYMSEVTAPPEIESLMRGLDLYDLSELIRSLAEAIATKYFELHNRNLSYSPEIADWLRVQSCDTWVRVLRWLAMEVI